MQLSKKRFFHRNYYWGIIFGAKIFSSTKIAKMSLMIPDPNPNHNGSAGNFIFQGNPRDVEKGTSSLVIGNAAATAAVLQRPPESLIKS